MEYPKFKELPKKTQDAFNDFADTNQDFIRAIMFLNGETKCIYCGKQFDKKLFQGFRADGEFMFHIKETHGYDPETFINIMQTYATT